jgi:4-amino-4-deoxy-L-arabinose transferase-like glycosyltransferase
MSRPAAALPGARDAVQEWRRHASPGLLPWVLGGWAVLVAGAVLLRPVLPIDETRYLAVAWEMWRSGDWISLRLNGEPYSHKPPLLFWSILTGWQFTGPGTVWPRLLTGLFALAALGLAARLARRVTALDDVASDGSRAGLVAVVTGSALGWMAFTGAVMFDLLLACCVLLAIGAVVDAAQGAGRGAAKTPWLVLLFALGAGLLAKGPVMLLHVLPVALLAPWWSATARARDWYPRLALVTAAGVAPLLLWALPVAEAGGASFSRELLWDQTWGRIATTTHHLRPPWFYLVTLPLLLLPWSLLPALWRGVAARQRSAEPMSGRRLLVAWIVPVAVAFSAFRGKQAQYLLPLVPAFAILILHVLETAWGDALRARVLRVAAASWIAMLALVAALGRAWGGDYDMTEAGRRIAAFESAGAPVAQLGKYHGQFHFAGRLAGRIEERPTAASLRAWARAHPTGAVVNYCPRSRGGVGMTRRVDGAGPSMPSPSYEQGFRSRRLQLWSAADFARLPDHDDGCGYAVRAALRAGDAGSRARLASAAAASIALAHNGASQPNQPEPVSPGSSSNAAAIEPTRSSSTRRAKGRSSSAQPTPTTAAVMTRA